MENSTPDSTTAMTPIRVARALRRAALETADRREAWFIAEDLTWYGQQLDRLGCYQELSGQ